MIDYSRVKRVRVPDGSMGSTWYLTEGKEYEFTYKPVTYSWAQLGDVSAAGHIYVDDGDQIYIILSGDDHVGSAPWEVLNPDTGEWELAK